ncbi:Holliday junction branch migration protein RuvA [Kineothrix sp. MB12-C1]|uniref:Holliday junction branch migration protein RuvA n=1 Tax=Kineothrix sp. MB12-C1 TaxID=3070215 RepID=UPI0027D243CA|nr:Holliday junction branch migration protein RuvA [Kineothrix sp. MB12-C1]WMC92854.1 Holliday junction branch migration protein RuvA [Kineothrix sp. MB12-C1]
MIAYIIGEVVDITEENLILEANNIGYNIKISSGTAGRLPRIGEEVKIYTYTHVREDAFLLFGFLTKDDLDIFKKLITVNGIGPKGGLAILSVMSADDLRFAIISADIKAISKAPGIGKKTAERVILDLRDKVSIEDAFMDKGTDGSALEAFSGETSARNEAIEALTALGYSSAEALKAVKQLNLTPDMDVEEILKMALKKMY